MKGIDINMKNLVVYYSLEGNTKLIAEMIAKEINADILELKPKKEIPTKGFRKYVWGGKSVMFKEMPTLINEDKDLIQYENIFLGTPVWAGTYAAPFNTFIAKNNILNKNVVLFACHAGGGANKCFVNLKKSLPNNHFVGEIDFIDPLKNNLEKSILKVKNWTKTLNI